VTQFAVDPEAGFRADAGDGVLTITLNRPDRLNCQSPATWEALTRVREELSDDLRVVVLRAEGRAFSAGLDRSLFTRADGDGILALPKLSRDDATARIAHWQQAFDWSSRPDLVSVAAVQGHAIGAGFQLALGADIRIVADDAQFTMAEPTLGLVPDLGGTKRLADLVGYSRAAEICLTGRRVDSGEALRIGLASHVVARESLDDSVQQTVQALLAVNPGASAATKELLQHAAGRSQDEQQAAEREAQYLRLRALSGL
jgi:enoyl-CoA hydratase/carnithine racemase